MTSVGIIKIYLALSKVQNTPISENLNFKKCTLESRKQDTTIHSAIPLPKYLIFKLFCPSHKIKKRYMHAQGTEMRSSPSLCRLPPTQARTSLMTPWMYSWCCNTVNRITRLTTLLKFGSKAPLNIAEVAEEQDPDPKYRTTTAVKFPEWLWLYELVSRCLRTTIKHSIEQQLDMKLWRSLLAVRKFCIDLSTWFLQVIGKDPCIATRTAGYCRRWSNDRPTVRQDVPLPYVLTGFSLHIYVNFSHISYIFFL